MPRSYHSAAAAFAIGRPPKWLDNVLSRYSITGIPRQTRGLSRAISLDALMILRITSDLCADLDLPVAKSLELAHALTASSDGTAVLSSGLRVQVDLTRARRALEHRLLETAETHLPPPRGRPPTRPGHTP
jgi:hypothetical protein